MKEITTEMTLKVMWHDKVKDEHVDEYIERDQDPEVQEQFAKAVAVALGADKVDIVGKVKLFVMDDVPEEKEN